MMFARQEIFVIFGFVIACQAFIGSGDEAYMKKFAIRKVWESCFGSEVVKQIRLEKRAAIAKCRLQAPNPGQTKLTGQMTPAELALVLASQQGAVDKVGQALSNEGPEPRPETLSRPSLVKDHFPPKKRPSVHPSNNVAPSTSASFDAAKLQALLNFKAQQNGYLQTQAYQPSAQQYNPFMAQYQPHNQYNQMPQYPQFPGSSNGYPFNAGGNYQQFPTMFPQGNSFYGQQQQQQQYPFYPQQQQGPVYQQNGYYGRQRPARELTLQNQIDLEALHRAIGAKAENVSCQLQELGYLDDNLEPDYEKISLRLKRLPVEEELKRDMIDGLEFCKRFSTALRKAATESSEEERINMEIETYINMTKQELEDDIEAWMERYDKELEEKDQEILKLRVDREQCMPDMRKDAAKFSQDQDKQMFFFSCYKHKKLEACLMKDVRERFLTDDPLTQEDLAGEDLRSLPRGRKAKMPDFKPKMNPEKFDDFFVNDDEMYFV